ncbi:hypothetical protein [Knoellia koreensis]|uniref:Alpha/beta hydrolase n=1 Tax=Knoellia koreensis TaxID=2730921 RepID=A0A849HLW4_9MICO|nr:hypothetical protein [Knoellia sp. DB2414S]NNM47534.1 hypothetical protein [Knoellia sp. DB2414S]
MVVAVVLPSPLLGPATYEPFVAELAALGGWRAGLAALPDDPSDPRDVLAAFARATERTDLVVAHSNAGYYLPVLSAHTDATLIAMDAALPMDQGRETPLAPTQFADFVTGLPLSEDRLPPWPAWWPRADVEPLFPTSDWFERVLAEAPRLRPSYFEGRLPVPVGWAAGRRAYLAFDDTYAAELAFATQAGWVVEQVGGGHLEYLRDPGSVARAAVDLAADVLASA